MSSGEKSSSKLRRDHTGAALKASIASKRRRRASSSDTSPPPPPPPLSLSTCTSNAAATAATPHLSLFTPPSPTPHSSSSNSAEFISLSDYEDLLELEREDLANMPCVQEMVEEYHQWYLRDQTLVNYMDFYPPLTDSGMYLLQT
jgi:hypothetical protein